MAVDMTSVVTSLSTSLGSTTTGVPAVAGAGVAILAGILALKFGLRLIRSFVR